MRRLKSSGIGGQAVIEGVMMKNKDQYAVAVRTPDNEIVVDKQEYHSVAEKHPWMRLPLIRGVVTFVESLSIGMKTLTYSASFYEEEEEQGKKEKKEEKKEEAVIDLEPKEEITFEQFGAMQFQVGEIIACEAVKKSKKLLCSQVKIGSQVKQIVSGIKAYYTPEEMVGKKVMVLVNLKPAKLAGVLSEGMLLCAEDADGNFALMTPEKEMPAGAEIC